MKTLLSLALSPLLLAASEAPQSPAPDWMAGSWIEAKGQDWSDEYWTLMRGGIMIGAARSGKGEVLEGWEHIRITRDSDGGLTYWGSPGGKPAVPFKMISSRANEIVFANPTHDYPQRIRYWREGKLLKAEVSLADGSKAARWTYSPMGRN